AAGADTIHLTGAAGCDSADIVVLTIKSPAGKTITTSICQGSSYNVGTQSFSTAGIFTVTLAGAAANGCDSIVTLNLTVK
ncbi:hypothetical protein ACI4B7_28600, partial [Klebsiella pneumoniae]|uniref:hypothetical protein n=1 Tax=Klebsiella pneumoniae TaxID=573 RepID=UPI003851C907